MKPFLPSHGVNFYKSLHQKARQRLVLERAVHQDQTKLLKEQFRQKCEKQCEQLAKGLKSDYDIRLEKLKGDYAAKEKAYEAKIIELRQTLSFTPTKSKVLIKKIKSTPLNRAL